MNETLKSELKEYFKKINERKKIIDKHFETYKLNYDKYDYSTENIFNKKIHQKAIEILRERKPNFEKERLNRNVVCVSNNELMIRHYKCHHFNSLDFLSRFRDLEIYFWLPIGFKKVVDLVGEELVKLDNFNKEMKYEKIIRTNIPIVFIKGVELNEDVVEEIKISEERVAFSLKNSYLYNEEEVYYNDEVYNLILKGLELRKRYFDYVQKRKNEFIAKINKIIDEDFDKILIIEGLKK